MNKCSNFEGILLLYTFLNFALACFLCLTALLILWNCVFWVIMLFFNMFSLIRTDGMHWSSNVKLVTHLAS